MPRSRGGVAKNRNPACGRASSPVRCSTIGIPADSRRVWTGLESERVSSMLTESIPTDAPLDRPAILLPLR